MPRSRFVSNTTALGVAAVLTTLFTFAQVKVLSNSLSMEAFGLLASLRGLSLLFSMLAANGLPQLLTRFLPSHQALGEKGAMLRLGLIAVAVTSALLILTLLAVHALRSFVFVEMDAGVAGGPFVFWFYATTIGVALKLVVYGGFGGMRRMDAQVALETVAMAIQIAWLFALRDSLSVAVVFRVLGIVSLLTIVVGLPWFLVQTKRDAVGELSSVGSGGRPRYMRYWFGATGLSIVAMAFTDVDRYILSYVIAFEMLGLFHIASRIAHIAKRFLGLPGLAFQPEITRLDTEGRHDDVLVATRVFVKFNVVISVLAAGLIVAYAPELIRVIASSAYLDATGLVVLFALSVPLSAMTAPLTTIMKARDEVSAAFWCDFAWATAYVISVVALTSVMGIIGAGIAMLIAGTIQLTTAVALSRLPLAERIPFAALIRTIVAVVVAIAPIVVFSLFWPTSGALAWLTKIGLVVPALLLFRWLLSLQSVLTSEERESLFVACSRGGLRTLASVLFK